MNPHPDVPTPTISARRSHRLSVMAALIAVLFTANAIAQAPAAPAAPAKAGATAPPTSEELAGLEKLVDRIALYPDDLIAIILPASTSPLQIVQADRFLDQRKANPKLAMDDKWDDPVKTLCNYPEVVKAMSKDIDWTAALGEAVVEDMGEVLEAVQAFRRKTQSAGNLKTDAKQVVVVEKEVIKIVPADPQVIYVPQYNPSTVVVYGGYSSWGYYPAPYPSYYYPYPPGAALATGLIWGAAIGAAWNGNHYGANYGGGNNTININNSKNINTGNVNRGNTASGGSQYKSNKSAGQVSSSVGKTASSKGAGYGSGSGSGARASTQGGAGAGSSAASKNMAGTSSSGAARSSAGSSGGSGGAFGGSGSSSGRQTSMDSSRGSSSRSASSGGGSRGGGGGGGGGSRGGGGGGGRR